MSRMIQRALISLVCFLTILLLGCGSTTAKREETERIVEKSALIDGLLSFESPVEVRSRLDPSVLPWEVVEDSALAPGDRRPPFHNYAVIIARYTDLDHSGELELHFFNDRLMEASFFSNNPDSYLHRLRDSRGIDLAATTKASLPRYTLVSTGSRGGRRYISWTDTRLSEEFDDWIRRYS